jgi:hypothetical protein
METFAAQVLQQLDHGLVDEFGIGPLESGVSGTVEPGRHDASELLGTHAGMRGHDELGDALLTRGDQRLQVPGQHGGERSLRLPFWVLRRQGVYAIEGERELGVHGLLDPKRAVVIEHRDPLRLGHEARATFASGGRDEIENCPFRSALDP